MACQSPCGLGWALEYPSLSSSFSNLVLRHFSEVIMENVPALIRYFCCLLKWSPGRLTSHVWQRPQQASVVMRSPLQPGLWAMKENSRTAQPRNPCSVLVRAAHTAAVPAIRRRRRRDRCMLDRTSMPREALVSYLFPWSIKATIVWRKFTMKSIFILIQMNTYKQKWKRLLMV